MAYSKDYRKRAIEYMEEGHSDKEIYETFKIYASNVRRWKKLLKETNSLKPQYRETRRRKIDYEKLKQAVERKPDMTLPELARKFDCTKQAIDYALRKLKITRKKRPSAIRKDVR